MGIAQDQQLSTEEGLRRSEERFRLLVEAVGDYAIYVLDPTGRITTWNAGAEKLKGYTAAEIIGQNFALFFPEADAKLGKPAAELATALRVGRFEEEGYRVRKDGTRFWANVVVTPMRDDSGTVIGFAKVTRDLTARIEAERIERELVREQAARAAAQAAAEQIRQAVIVAREAAQEAERANRVKDEFLATVSHELRTPLNAILGWSTLLRTRNRDVGLTRAIDVIHRNALAQGKIIEDILDVSRIITGKLRLDLKTIDLERVVRDAIEVVLPSASAKGIKLVLTTMEEGAELIADAERIQQVVWNLLSNAVKFSDNDTQIDVVLQEDSGDLTLSVTDRGRGIEPAFLPYVFDRFQQADSSLTRRVGGLGLGLAIVRHLVELHGGTVTAQSGGAGTGATFTIRLPTHATSEVPAEQAAVKRPSDPPRRKAPRSLANLRVLVVDDQDDARDLAQAVLSGAGAIVEVASSAAEAFHAVQRFRPHVMISDIGMPDEDGYGLIRSVRALPTEAGGRVPSIALSAFTRVEDQSRALAAGFNRHVAKPVHPDDLLDAVADLAATR